MPNFIDLTGMKFNRWTVLKRTHDYISKKGSRRAMWICECSCGDILSVRGDDLRNGKSESCGCIHKEMLRSKCGKNSYSWKGGLSSESNLARNTGEQQKWTFNVFKRDEFTCKKCGDRSGGNLNAHHILSFSRYPDTRTELENGTTLCKKCHMAFHKLYGTRSFTDSDYWEWMDED